MNKLTHKRIVVTGGTGLLGSHLVAELLLHGCTCVKLLVRNSRHLGLLQQTLERMQVPSGIDRLTFEETALNNPHTLREAVTGAEVVFHCAAQLSYDPEQSDAIISSNTEMTTHVVNSCLECHVGLFIHVSSIATLGTPSSTQETITETTILNSLIGRSAYSVSKIYAENVVRRAMTQGLRTIIVNPSIILGEGAWNKGSAQLIAFGARNNLFYTSGVKGYVDVRDVARAMILLAEEPKAVGQRFIVSAENLSFQTLFTWIAAEAGCRKPRIGLGKPLLKILCTLEKEIARWTGHSRLLSDSFIANAVECSRYSSDKLLHTIPFAFTPIRTTLQRVTRQYLKDKKR